MLHPHIFRLCICLFSALLLCAWQPDAVSAGEQQTRKHTQGSHKAQVRAKNTKPAAHTKSKGKSRGKARRAAPVQTSVEGMRVNAKAAYLMNMTTGQVYFTQDPDRQIPPASITKVLTLFLVRDALAQGRLGANTAIPVSALAIRTGGSTMTLYKGERVPVSELIKGISVVSANNACVAVAEYLGRGDSGRFVTQMNAKARSLGMTRSVFRNPNGLPASGQVTTARDIARLSAAYLRRYPESLAVHSMTTHTHNGVTHRNANSLLGRYDGADGLKTGFVCASGYNITATARRGDTRLVAVVLGAPNPIVREVETSRLLDYGFAQAAASPAKARKRPHS